MIVTVISVTVVQVRCDDVIGVIAVRHPLVAATIAVSMFRGMPAASVRSVAVVRLPRRNGKSVFVDAIFMRAMEMPVMNVVDVVLVLNLRMSAVIAVPMAVAWVRCVCHAQSLIQRRPKSSEMPDACNYGRTRTPTLMLRGGA